jgi:hypothetical protein
MRKTAFPVVWEGDGAQSPSLDPIPAGPSYKLCEGRISCVCQVLRKLSRIRLAACGRVVLGLSACLRVAALLLCGAANPGCSRLSAGDCDRGKAA